MKSRISSLEKALKGITVGEVSGKREIYYTVKKGDCLYKIAKRFNTTVKALKKINKLKGDIIYPGQKLKISK